MGESNRWGAVRSAALLSCVALAASACVGGFFRSEPQPTQYLLEAPPPSEDLVGKLSFHETRAEDTLIDLAAARLLPSGPREGIVVNLGDLHLYYFEKGAPVRAYPIGIAKDGYATPQGVTQVKAKREKPPWIPGASARRDKPDLPARVPPGPDNPLGEHVLYLGWPSYLIHGTNDPRGVGRHSSRGCIRLYPDDIAELYGLAGPGTGVRVVNEPVKLGWIGGELYLEVNPDADESLLIDETGKHDDAGPPAGLRKQVEKAAGKESARIDWERVDYVGQRRFGVPSRITR